MNKAFVRESDHDVRQCPFCGSLGQAVGRVTLDALVDAGGSPMYATQIQRHVFVPVGTSEKSPALECWVECRKCFQESR